MLDDLLLWHGKMLKELIHHLTGDDDDSLAPFSFPCHRVKTSLSSSRSVLPTFVGDDAFPHLALSRRMYQSCVDTFPCLAFMLCLTRSAKCDDLVVNQRCGAGSH